MTGRQFEFEIYHRTSHNLVRFPCLLRIVRMIDSQGCVTISLDHKNSWRSKGKLMVRSSFILASPMRVSTSLPFSRLDGDSKFASQLFEPLLGLLENESQRVVDRHPIAPNPTWLLSWSTNRAEFLLGCYKPLPCESLPQMCSHPLHAKKSLPCVPRSFHLRSCS